MEGLQNLGSTCAVNSLIQIICRTKKLREALLTQILPDNSLGNELKDILDLMYVRNKSLIPHKFVNSLYNTLQGIFIRGEQIDIGELWTIMFDKISTEAGVPYSIKLTNNKIKDECNMFISKFNNNKTSLWLETSQGILVNIITCKMCSYNSYNFEPFTCLTLDIINDNIPSITDMLKKYIETEERIADEWRCDKCNTCSNYSKTIKIWKAPDVLFLLIKRFKDDLNKDTRYIKINKSLYFGESTILENNIEKQYNLSSIGLHYGSLYGGHYMAICNIGNGKYYQYDDLQITDLTANNENDINKTLEKNNNGYIIVYESI
jgi:ubiquitin C-terminal hydrolase